MQNNGRCGYDSRRGLVNTTTEIYGRIMNPSTSYASFKDSNDTKDSPHGLVQTNSGHLHFIDRRVTLGVKSLTDDAVNSAVSLQTEATLKAPMNRHRKAKSEGNLSKTIESAPGFVTKGPKLGEERTVIMDMHWTKFGFQLQSYSRMSDRGKTQQTVVLAVTVGSPAFMAGLHQGDAIIEVNGENVRNSSPDEIVDKIMNTTDSRVRMVVEFVDGVRRNALKRRRAELKRTILKKQEALKRILASGYCPTSYTGITASYTEFNQSTRHSCSKSLIENSDKQLCYPIPAHQVEAGTGPQNLNVYTEGIVSLKSEVLVLPLGNPVDEVGGHDQTDNEVLLTTLLQAGGDKLINELSLVAQEPKLGGIFITSGGKLPGIKTVCHCVFGGYDIYLSECLDKALKRAMEKSFNEIAFWIDGFLAVDVSPQKFLELLQEVLKQSTYKGAVIIASSAIHEVQLLVKDVFHIT